VRTWYAAGQSQRAIARELDPEFELRAAARAYRDQVLAWEREQQRGTG